MKYEKVKLKEISTYVTERIETEKVDEENYISTENMVSNKGGKVRASKLPNSKSVIAYKPGDVLISNIRPYFKKIWFSSNIGGSSADVLVIRPNEKVIPDYLYYFLSQDKIFDYMVQTSKGTKMPRGDKQALMEYELAIPNLDIQKNISKFFSNIDKKIEINNSLISNLEELAQTLFKRWFVDFEFPNEEGKPYKSSGGKMVESELGMIPEGWGVTNIQSMPVIISDHVANGSFASIKKNVQIVEDEDYALFLRNTDLKQDLQGERRYVTKSSYDFLKKTQLFGGEVIISNVGDVGTIHRCPSLNRPMVLGNNLIVIQPTEQNEVLNTYFYFLFKSFEGKKLIKSITSGSVQMKFNKTDFRNLKIVIPESFEKMNMNILKKILLKVDLLKQEIESLSNLRDTLLPKLLSGEIELPDDMEVTEDVPIS